MKDLDYVSLLVGVYVGLAVGYFLFRSKPTLDNWQLTGHLRQHEQENMFALGQKNPNASNIQEAVLKGGGL